MKVQVEEDLFAHAFQRRYPNLVPSLFHVCVERGHVVSLDREGALFRQWLKTQSQLQQDEAELVLDRSCELEARLAIDCVIIASTAASDWALTPPRVGPEDLVAVVNHPLSVLVENGGNDGAFLRCMGFGIDRRNLNAAFTQGRVSFPHGGGSASRGELERRSLRERFRTWFVFDSDALAPNLPSKEAQQKVETCKREGLQHRYHMLQRRCMENYLPAAALLLQWPHEGEAHHRAQAFGQMSDAQRAHFNLEAGFRGDQKRLAPDGTDAAQKPDVDALYTSEPQPDRQRLDEGFGKKKLRELFTPERLPDELRRKDGQEPEMGSLIRRILRWL